MQSPDAQRMLQKIKNIDHAFLVCTEKPPKHCHRFLLLDMIDSII